MTLAAYDEAIAQYERALVGLGEDSHHDDRRCDLLLVLGEARWGAGRHAEAQDAFLLAADAATKLGAADKLVLAAFGYGGKNDIVSFSFGGATLIVLLERALDLLDKGDSGERAVVMSRLAQSLWISDDIERRGALTEGAIAMARRIGDDRVLARVLISAHNATWAPGNLAQRLATSAEAVCVAERAGDRLLLALARRARIADLLETGDVLAAARHRDAHWADVEKVRDSHRMAHAFLQWSTWALMEGRFGEVEGIVSEAVGIADHPDTTLVSQGAALHLMLLRREQYRLGEMLPAMEQLAASNPDVPAWNAALAWAYAELGRNEAARRALDDLSADEFAGLRQDIMYLGVLWLTGEVTARLGDEQSVESLYRLALPYRDRFVAAAVIACAGSFARVLGVLATRLGRFDEAEGHLEYALARNRMTGARPWHAYTQLDYAQMLLQRASGSDVGRAAELLTSARAEAADMGMVSLERRIAAVVEHAALSG